MYCISYFPFHKIRDVTQVLGFGGAKPRYVQKYASLYNDKGCSTIFGTATNYDVFVDHAGLDAFAKDAIQSVASVIREEEAAHPHVDPHKQQTPLVMHILSNGGAFVTRNIGHMLDSRREGDNDSDLELFASRLKMGAQIFDSAPCYMDNTANFNVIKHLIPNPFIGMFAAVLFSLRSSLGNAVSMMTGTSTHADFYWNAWIEDTNCNRQAFIYSEKDDIANSKKIEEFIGERKKRGVNVSVKHFRDSVHVQHLRYHPEEYSTFIDGILTDMEEDNSKVQEEAEAIRSRL